MRLLQQLVGLKVAALSLFRPHVVLPVHSHPELAEEGLLTFHLGLSCPPNCWLGTDGRLIREIDGEAIVFNGARPHFSFNFSPQDRLILYLEFDPQRVEGKP